MSDLSWNYYWTEGKGSSWASYLRNRDIVRAVNDGTESAATHLAACMNENTCEIVGSIENLEHSISAGLERVSDNLATGFEDTNRNIERIGHQISAAFTWGFNAMLASMGGMQTTLDQLLKVAKTPAQTAAFEQFEIARDAFRRGLYVECLEALQNAIDGVSGVSTGYKIEWRFHQLRGLVLLGSHDHYDPKIINPADAEQAFLMAARYARKDFPGDAANALLAAGWAAYVQAHISTEKLRDALAHAEEAVTLAPNLGEALFQTAKFQMALGNPDAAMPMLKQAADLGGLYIAKAAADGDFKRHNDKLHSFLHALREEKLEQTLKIAKPIAEKISALKAEYLSLSEYPAARRIIAFAERMESTGIVDLIDYGGMRLAKDKAELEAYRIVVSSSIESVPNGEMERYESIEQVEYEEEVAGWFSRKIVKKTRPATVLRERPVMVDVEKFNAINGLGGPFVLRPTPIRIDPGSFIMSDRYEGKDPSPTDRPDREVRITQAFEIWNVPVTQAQYGTIMGLYPSHFKGQNHPVESLNWFEAVKFCNALSRSVGLPEAYIIDNDTVMWQGPQHPGWRLPSRAEWEYACRAGTTGYRYGNLDEIAWYNKNSGHKTHPVGEKKPNAWGLYDMLGNVFEWGWDEIYESSCPTGPVKDSNRSIIMVMGGCWETDAMFAQAALWGYASGDKGNMIGVRPVRSI
ncbi:MAG: SUMF1/EgtB/PvdO family nonheme iron enzyme [Phycisphaerales bacterium]